MDTTQVKIGERFISLLIRRHARARRISLRLSPGRDSIIMTLPRRAAVASGMEFFTSKSKWVLENIDAESTIAFAEGMTVPILGKSYTIQRVPGRGVSELSEENGRLTVYGLPEFTPRRVRDFLKKHLQQECLRQATLLAGKLGKTIRELRIRDTRSRWGSCTTSGRLTFNWRLVFAEPAILHYLIAHEVAHLVEMNHSDRFWKVVATLCPNYENARKWLKKEGHTLHRYN